jgi:hypothetical protein
VDDPLSRFLIPVLLERSLYFDGVATPLHELCTHPQPLTSPSPSPNTPSQPSLCTGGAAGTGGGQPTECRAAHAEPEGRGGALHHPVPAGGCEYGSGLNRRRGGIRGEVSGGPSGGGGGGGGGIGHALAGGGAGERGHVEATGAWTFQLLSRSFLCSPLLCSSSH